MYDTSLINGKSFINGEWVSADSGETVPVYNPATGEVVAEVAKCGTDETRRAVEAASAALPAWKKKAAKERSALLIRLYELMMEHQDELAWLMTAEQGKPLAEAKGEIAYAASFLQWFGEEAKRVYGDTIPAPRPGQKIVVTHDPIGVVACITPWNFPQRHADPQNWPCTGCWLYRGL